MERTLLAAAAAGFARDAAGALAGARAAGLARGRAARFLGFSSSSSSLSPKSLSSPPDSSLDSPPLPHTLPSLAPPSDSDSSSSDSTIMGRAAARRRRFAGGCSSGSSAPASAHSNLRFSGLTHSLSPSSYSTKYFPRFALNPVTLPL